MRSLQALVLAVALLPAVASAQTSEDEKRNAARDLGLKGNAAYEQGDFATAIDLYRRASSLYPVPTLSVRLGRALVKLGRLVEAEEAYIKTLRYELPATAPDAFKQAIVVAKADLAELSPRVPRLKLSVTGATQPTVTIDSKLLEPALVGIARKVDPGTYKIRAEAPGSLPSETTVELKEGEQKDVRLELKPDPNAKPVPPGPKQAGAAPGTITTSSASPWPFVALGLGGVGLGVGIVTGLMSNARRADAESACPDLKCERGSAGESDLNAFRDLRTVSSIGYVIGAVGVAAGGVLFLTLDGPGDTGPDTSATAAARGRTRLYVGAGSVGVLGGF